MVWEAQRAKEKETEREGFANREKKKNPKRLELLLV